jgi:hypothetical protein
MNISFSFLSFAPLAFCPLHLSISVVVVMIIFLNKFSLFELAKEGNCNNKNNNTYCCSHDISRSSSSSLFPPLCSRISATAKTGSSEEISI